MLIGLLKLNFISTDNVIDVLSGATHVQILPVITACENYLRDHFTIDNCINTATVAELFFLPDLLQHAFNFICRNWTSISMCDEFHHLSPNFLINLLSSGYPVDCKETDVLISVLSWFTIAPSERVNYMKSILNCIAFEYITLADFDSTLNSKEWQDVKDALPDLLRYFPNLVENQDIHMMKDNNICNLEKAISLDGTNNIDVNSSPFTTLSQFERKSLSMLYLQQQNCPPGIINMRGYRSTVLVAGGFRNESGMTNNLMYLDQESGSLCHLSKIPHLDQINFGMTMYRNQLYVIGGCFNDHMQEIAHPFGFRYNPTSNTWSSIAPMLQERCRFLLCATDDTIYAIGGDPYASDVGLENVAACEMYCPKTNEWNSIQPLPGNRSQLAGTCFRNYVAVSGGIQENDELVFNDFYLYDPSSDSWEKRADMLVPRTDHTMLVWEGNIHVIGGWHLDPVTKKRVLATSIDCYDFDSDSWEVVSSLNIPRTYGTYTLNGDNIYAIGGWFDGDHLRKFKTIDIFNLRKRVWVQGEEQKFGLWEHCASSLYLPKFVSSTNTES